MKNQSKAKLWEKTIDDWNKTKLSQAAYCRKFNISPRQFYRWKHKLSLLQQNTKQKFIPVEVADCKDAQGLSLKINFPNGCSISIAQCDAEKHLKTLFQAASSC